MKKITLLLMLLSVTMGFSQFLEDFNGTGVAFPPAGWAVYSGANGLGTVEQWVQDGVDPDFRPQNLWEAVTPGQVAEDWIVTPLISINATQNVLLFDATDLNSGSFGSELSIRVSTTSQTDTTSFVEIENLDESELGNNANPVFSNFNVSLAAYLNQSVYIAFVHVQNDGDAVTFDNVEVIQGASAPPSAATTPTPSDGATGVVVDRTDTDADGVPDDTVTFSWGPSLGNAPDDYEFTLGTDPTNLISIGVTPNTGASIGGLFRNTTYYWQAIPGNTAGRVTNQPVWSFTTEMLGTAPGDAVLLTPADLATNVQFDPTDADGDGTPDNTINFTWSTPATGDAVEAYIFRLGTTAAVDLFSSNRGTDLALDLAGLAENTTYFWRIDPQNISGVNGTGPVFQFTTGTVASNDDNKATFFTISPNPTSDYINITTESEIENIEIMNALGQMVNKDVRIANNRINVSPLKNGLYFIKATSTEGVQTLRFIKK